MPAVVGGPDVSSQQTEVNPPRARIIRNDRYGRPMAALNTATRNELKIVREAARRHECHGRCGRWILDGTTYAQLLYPDGRVGGRYWGFPLVYKYHIECLPADANEMLPLFFPNQTWEPKS